jgi:hypothetical protein
MANNQDKPALIETRIHFIRGLSVMLDSDLASLYGVSVKALLQAVRRNRERFPASFIFQLANQEVTNLRSQIVTSSLGRGYGGRRYSPWAFTEQGIAMLSSVLRSDTAVQVNIEVMRAFVRLRRAAAVSSQVMSLVEDLSKRVEAHDSAASRLARAPALATHRLHGGSGRFRLVATRSIALESVALVALALKYQTADVPIKHDHGGVGGQHDTGALALHTLLDCFERGAVVNRYWMV